MYIRPRDRKLAAAAAAVVAVAAAVAVTGERLRVKSGPGAAIEVRSSSVTQLPTDPGGPFTTIYEDTLPACSTCTVRLRPVGAFGAIDDSILLRSEPLVERDSHGRFYAIPRAAADHELIVYDSTGQIVRTIGGFGSGPGEFRRGVGSLFVGKDDSLYVAHDHGVSVFDSAGVLARTLRLTPPPAVASWDHRIVAVLEEGIVINLHRFLPDPGGIPLHLYDDQGRYVRSFGPRSLNADRHMAQVGRADGFRTTGLDTTNSLWLAEPSNYRVQNVGLDGSVRRVIVVRAPLAFNATLWMTQEEAEDPSLIRPPLWEPERPEPVAPDRAVGPGLVEVAPRVPDRMRVTGLSPLQGGLLLVHLTVASTQWRNARIVMDYTQATEGPSALPGFAQHRWDTVLDIVELETGAMLARTRVPGTGGMTTDGTLYLTTVDELGIVNVRAFEMDVVRSGG